MIRHITSTVNPCTLLIGYCQKHSPVPLLPCWLLVFYNSPGKHISVQMHLAITQDIKNVSHIKPVDHSLVLILILSVPSDHAIEHCPFKTFLYPPKSHAPGLIVVEARHASCVQHQLLAIAPPEAAVSFASGNQPGSGVVYLCSDTAIDTVL